MLKFVLLVLILVPAVLSAPEEHLFESPPDLFGAGSSFGASLAYNEAGDFMCAGAVGIRPNAETTASGVVDCYYKNFSDEWEFIDRLATNGTADHFSTNSIKFVEIGSHLIEIYIPAFGTPVGDMNSTTHLNDRRGSLRVYRFNKATKQIELRQVLDSSTPGLEDLSPSPFNSSDNIGAKFGIYSAIAPHGLRMAVTAFGQNIDEFIEAGAVYTFYRFTRFSQWNFHKKLIQPGGPAGDFTYFGAQVAMTNSMLFVSNAAVLVGAPDEPRPELNTKVWVYKYYPFFGYHHIQTLNSSQTQEETDITGFTDMFGCTMSATPNTLVVGACFANNGGLTRGAVYIFKLEGWGVFARYEHAQILSSPTPADRNIFGTWGLDIYDNIIAVADPALTVNGTVYRGGAQIFKEDSSGTWVHGQTITYDDSLTYQFDGAAVAIGNDGTQLMLGNVNTIDFIYGTSGVGPFVRGQFATFTLGRVTHHNITC